MDVILKIINSKSKTFLAFCFCFIVGAGVASLSSFPSPFRGGAGGGVYGFGFYFYISIFLLLFLAIIFWHKWVVRFFILCCLFIIFGIWRFTLTIPNCSSPTQICFYNGREATVIGRVSAEPDVRIDKARYAIDVIDLPLAPALKSGGIATSSPFKERTEERSIGKILLTTRIYPRYNYGDVLEIKCKLQTPENEDGTTFNYQKYLAKDGIYSVCNFAKNVTVIPTPLEWNTGERAMSAILNLKSKVQSQIDQLWPEPESSFMAGLLYGSKAGLPPELSDNFNKTGLTHIIAVSGFNITIIATVLMSVLIFIGLWRRQAYWAVMGVLLLFVVFTGATASVVRAAIMGGLVLTAQYIGRLSRIGNVLVFTAAVMTLFNPYVLFWDAGFQLSFLATLGLVYISPILSKYDLPLTSALKSGGSEPSLFKGREGWGRLWSIIREPLIQTLSAIIATLPLILYQFGRLSLVAPFANILVLWIIPWLMLFGFAAVIISFIFFPLGQLVAFFASLGLKYVILLVNWLGELSWSAVGFNVPLWLTVLLYFGIFYAINKWQKYNYVKEKN